MICIVVQCGVWQLAWGEMGVEGVDVLEGVGYDLRFFPIGEVGEVVLVEGGYGVARFS